MIGRKEIDDQLCEVLRTLDSIKTQVTPMSRTRVDASIITLEAIRVENAKGMVFRCQSENAAMMRPSQCMLSDGHDGDHEWGTL